VEFFFAMGNMIKTWTRVNTGGADGSVVMVKSEGDIRNFTRFGLRCAAGQVRVFGSIDGTNYPTSPLVLSLEPAVDGSDNVTENQGTFVAATSGTRLHWFFGVYRALRIVQKGATAANVTLMASEI
jgi:hypothetical protein